MCLPHLATAADHQQANGASNRRNTTFPYALELPFGFDPRTIDTLPG